MEARLRLVPVSTTIFSWFNLTLTATVVAVMTVAIRLLYPREADVRRADEVIGASRAMPDIAVDRHGDVQQAE